ncbi:cytochrome c-type biogenesis protein [Paracoccus sp. IB05]|uniref:cytochrome c-type biogenesis protein n=1 Tax=Paracoccus sp. IB05 TaxID=2779367 RepID=UPI0018E835AC|nr:cytochrome c-type biogenesis protein [Paracoccus sp. IB05]MBJ2151241.1 cytochrome c-type biogenesis protein CcmH [Paracoccus sp. IB05]
MRLRAFFIAVLMLLAGPVLAVQPDEILQDPGLETRARMISREIRCPVCQGETIDDSTAPISRDLRLIIRERLLAGDSNDEVIDFVVERYGEFVLFKPRASGWNWVLWLSGPVALLAAAGGIWLSRRQRQAAPPGPPVPLSAEEEARLAEILKD